MKDFDDDLSDDLADALIDLEPLLLLTIFFPKALKCQHITLWF